MTRHAISLRILATGLVTSLVTAVKVPLFFCGYRHSAFQHGFLLWHFHVVRRFGLLAILHLFLIFFFVFNPRDLHTTSGVPQQNTVKYARHI